MFRPESMTTGLLVPLPFVTVVLNRAVSPEPGAALFQFPVSDQSVLDEPVHVWVAANKVAAEVESPAKLNAIRRSDSLEWGDGRWVVVMGLCKVGVGNGRE